MNPLLPSQIPSSSENELRPLNQPRSVSVGEQGTESFKSALSQQQQPVKPLPEESSKPLDDQRLPAAPGFAGELDDSATISTAIVNTEFQALTPPSLVSASTSGESVLELESEFVDLDADLMSADSIALQAVSDELLIVVGLTTTDELISSDDHALIEAAAPIIPQSVQLLGQQGSAIELDDLVIVPSMVIVNPQAKSVHEPVARTLSPAASLALVTGLNTAPSAALVAQAADNQAGPTTLVSSMSIVPNLGLEVGAKQLFSEQQGAFLSNGGFALDSTADNALLERKLSLAPAPIAAGSLAPVVSSLQAEGRVQIPVNIQFGNAGWGSMLAERSAMMAAQNIKFAEIKLDPPELGPLQVRVTVNQEQAHVSFVAANAQVKEAVDQSIVRLREMLERQGLDLVDVDVSDQSQQEGEGFDEEGNRDSAANAEDSPDAEAAPQTLSIGVGYGIDQYA